MRNIEPFGTGRADLDRSPLEVARLLSRPFWRELRTFLAVAKSTSFAQAARLLNTSAPTVSRDVKRLQDELGAQLVVSGYSGIKLTPTGHALALDLADLDYRLSTLSSGLRRERGALAGRVSVSAPSGIGVAFVAPAVARLNQDFPDIELDIKDQLSFVNFEKNLADIQIGLSRIGRTDFVCEEVGTLHLVPIAAEAYLARRGRLDQGGAGHAFLQCGYYEDASGRWRGWNELAAAGRVTHHCENSLAYYALAKAAAGIALLGTYALLEPRLRRAGSEVHVPLPIYITAEAARLQSPPVRAVYDWYRAQFLSNPFFSPDLSTEPGSSEAETDFRSFFNLDA